ncbi:unnamed protein product [Bursaphelenchus xylophilus]|uniref:(pine wood nematode) hypothetical protein n=1 Tax=Bursaphelenchus xylophilus TaxID=6326 RepID=A0A811KSF0_BURXY|nr:unnamed protein product [Bursaphelenchus xylophilus]CAG9102159.1 unnamed protein product [Bursaphelenchus xylophilus]
MAGEVPQAQRSEVDAKFLKDSKKAMVVFLKRSVEDLYRRRVQYMASPNPREGVRRLHRGLSDNLSKEEVDRWNQRLKDALKQYVNAENGERGLMVQEVVRAVSMLAFGRMLVKRFEFVLRSTLKVYAQERPKQTFWFSSRLLRLAAALALVL